MRDSAGFLGISHSPMLYQLAFLNKVTNVTWATYKERLILTYNLKSLQSKIGWAPLIQLSDDARVCQLQSYNIANKPESRETRSMLLHVHVSVFIKQLMVPHLGNFIQSNHFPEAPP